MLLLRRQNCVGTHHEDDPKLSEESTNEQVQSVTQGYYDTQMSYSEHYHQQIIEGDSSDVGPSYPSTSTMANEYSYPPLSETSQSGPPESYEFNVRSEASWPSNNDTAPNAASYADSSYHEGPSNFFVTLPVQEGGGLIGESSNLVYAQSTEALQSGQHEGGFLTRAPEAMPVQVLHAYGDPPRYYIDHPFYRNYHDTPPESSDP